MQPVISTDHLQPALFSMAWKITIVHFTQVSISGFNMAFDTKGQTFLKYRLYGTPGCPMHRCPYTGSKEAGYISAQCKTPFWTYRGTISVKFWSDATSTLSTEHLYYWTTAHPSSRQTVNVAYIRNRFLMCKLFGWYWGANWGFLLQHPAKPSWHIGHRLFPETSMPSST